MSEAKLPGVTPKHELGQWRKPLVLPLGTRCHLCARNLLLLQPSLLLPERQGERERERERARARALLSASCGPGLLKVRQRCIQLVVPAPIRGGLEMFSAHRGR